MIYLMGSLSYSAGVRASRLESRVLTMIAKAIVAIITPLQMELINQRHLLFNFVMRLDLLAYCIEDLEKAVSSSNMLIALRADVTTLR